MDKLKILSFAFEVLYNVSNLTGFDVGCKIGVMGLGAVGAVTAGSLIVPTSLALPLAVDAGLGAGLGAATVAPRLCKNLGNWMMCFIAHKAYRENIGMTQNIVDAKYLLPSEHYAKIVPALSAALTPCTPRMYKFFSYILANTTVANPTVASTLVNVTKEVGVAEFFFDNCLE